VSIYVHNLRPNRNSCEKCKNAALTLCILCSFGLFTKRTKPSILVQPSKAQQTSFKLAEFILEDGWDGKQTRGPDIISVNDGFSV
jgi:hypothetical protein